MTPIRTQIFSPLPHYKSIQAKGEQDSQFWQEVTVTFVDNKHTMKNSCNGYLISIYQEEPLHKLYFIAINNHGQAIIGLNKKIVATHIVGELEVMI